MKHDADDRHLRDFPQDEEVFHTALGHPLPGIFEPRLDRHLAMVGCFRPRQCGIATFTADSYDHLLAAVPGMKVDIYAMRSAPDQPGDAAMAMAIDEQDRATYRTAADAINRSGAAAVWLQHEFGIFGGEAGDLVLDLVDRVAAPLIVTFHTILAQPSAPQRRVVKRLVARASRLVVMSGFGRDTLVSVYGADPARIALIEHGTPDRPYVERSPLRDGLGIGNRPVLSTFGLIGQGKGLEAAIRALPAVAERHPDVLYRIVGATHPNLIAHEGEAYRRSLEDLAESLGVAGNIAWENRFLDLPELLDQIELCDIYLAPYPNLAQITSGTLAYAVALGRAVVSTPFVHARELLADGVGVLLPDTDSQAIADAVLKLLADPGELSALRRRAYQRGRQTAWPTVAGEFARVLRAAVGDGRPVPATRAAPPLHAVRAMSDAVGMLQHACGIVPDRAHGYCIDDNARALMLEVALGSSRHSPNHGLSYASFVQHAWNPDKRRFRNFMGYDRRWLEDEGSEDSNGRALWALGWCAGRASSPDLAVWALGWFDRTRFMAAEFTSPRSIAFAMLGAAEVLTRHSGNDGARAMLADGSDALLGCWHASSTEGWQWFEAGLAYDNARLPQALIRVGEVLGKPDYTRTGLAGLDWLCRQQTGSRGQFRPVGSEGFALAGETLPFDQQPLEAWATIDACGAAFRATEDAVWSSRAESAWRWFHGDNDRSLALVDGATGLCRDGLTPHGVNANTGAESLLAFHLAYVEMNALFWPRGIVGGSVGGISGKASFTDAALQTRPFTPAIAGREAAGRSIKGGAAAIPPGLAGERGRDVPRTAAGRRYFGSERG
ncbi:glycosyltransferase family 4 protein [Altererythrobacter sp. KTW20L]|uniref:glycosyltransferase family 4 protein n=1 Tax=Altererythrobacter sp. KTW20L TaxID=2942210 RepID=UPI0020BED11C|nr:glycosyltransferase family 4 protein [Altererythrobacter sp. KTW20L]MCL6250797.1 glycosyltransferase family 4 protein [Altererythrobacter sp. KTW20L]